VVIGIIILNLFLLTKHPSNDRDWNNDQKILPTAEISGNLVTIHNVRNIAYRSTSDYTLDYYDRTYDLNDLQKVFFVVEPFSGFVGSAHTFLSFQFSTSTFVSISVEIRKEKGESFSALKGILRSYEIMYVVADERDVIKLRSNFRKDKVFIYPARTEKGKQLFLSMISRANELAKKPEFYNTLTNTCTTNIVSHINALTPKRISWLDYRVLLPENSDTYAHEMGLIDTDLSLEQAREKYLINERAMKYADDNDFSLKIRE
jgi:hypothetical protein